MNVGRHNDHVVCSMHMTGVWRYTVTGKRHTKSLRFHRLPSFYPKYQATWISPEQRRSSSRPFVRLSRSFPLFLIHHSIPLSVFPRLSCHPRHIEHVSVGTGVKDELGADPRVSFNMASKTDLKAVKYVINGSTPHVKLDYRVAACVNQSHAQILTSTPALSELLPLMWSARYVITLLDDRCARLLIIHRPTRVTQAHPWYALYLAAYISKLNFAGYGASRSRALDSTHEF